MPIEALHTGICANGHLVLFCPLGIHHGKLDGLSVLEVLRKMDAVVCQAWLLTKNSDVKRAVAYHADEFHDEVMADWAVPNHDDLPTGELNARWRPLTHCHQRIGNRAAAGALLAQLCSLHGILEPLRGPCGRRH